MTLIIETPLTKTKYSDITINEAMKITEDWLWQHRLFPGIIALNPRKPFKVGYDREYVFTITK